MTSTSRRYYRVMLGRKSAHAQQSFAGGYVGVDDITGDLSGQLPDDWREFNRKFIPIFLAKFRDKSKIAAGLAGGVTWTLCKGIRKGDVIISPDGMGRYRVGEVTSDYQWASGQAYPHRRAVHWLDATIDRTAMSESLRNSTGSVNTISEISRYADEIEHLIGGAAPPKLIATDETIEDPVAFAMEKHLEEFLVQNWASTELGKSYDIYEEEGERVGQQYATDTGPMDVLAVSKDKKQLLVVELKKGRASDAVVGQILRYMGYVMQVLAEPDQTVHGVIIALDNDQRVRRALAAVPNVTFYRYEVSFRLIKG
ncbi:MAG: DUF91 domain-containing protein [Betaproteobacteria bacterium]|nr:DUF91 domain-containing protein [Betaproteobacteria bacterium]